MNGGYSYIYRIDRVSEGLQLNMVDYLGEYREFTLVMLPVGSTYCPSKTRSSYEPMLEFTWALQVSGSLGGGLQPPLLLCSTSALATVLRCTLSSLSSSSYLLSSFLFCPTEAS
jgi:hypothetical protein